MDLRIRAPDKNLQHSKVISAAGEWIETFRHKFSTDDLKTMLHLGRRFHDCGNDAYDQIFTLPDNGPIEYQARALLSDHALYCKLVLFENRTRTLMKCFVETIDTIAFVPTMLTPGGRTRIPIHTHLARRNDGQTEKTLTVCWRLSPNVQDGARFRFYPETNTPDGAGLHENLFSSEAFVEHKVTSPVEVILFTGVDTPHTVLFDDSFYMFCVANNVEPLDSTLRTPVSHLIDVVR